MTVGELIEQLQKHDANAKVYVYAREHEEGDTASDVMASERAKKLYFKGDAPWVFDEDDNFVVVG